MPEQNIMEKPYDLQNLQADFVASVLQKNAKPTSLSEYIIANNIDTQTRLSIYRNNVYSQISNALSDTYAAVKELVGIGFWANMTKDYISTNPPLSPSLISYGIGFAEFIASYEPAETVPYLADTARFEWAWHEAFFAENDEAITQDNLQKLMENAETDLLDNDKITFRNSVKIIKSSYNANEIWEYVQNTSYKNPTDKQPTSPEISPQEQYLLFWRDDENNVQYTKITKCEYQAFEIIMNNNDIEQIADIVTENGEEFDITSFFSKIFELQIVRNYALCH